MALTICKVCGNRISATAQDCPYCAEIPAIVKVEIAVLVLFLMALMIVVRHIPQTKQLAVQEAVSIAEGALFNIPKIAGKTEAEVEALLGEPVFCGQSESARNCSFKENEIEIVFINGKADWITIYGAFRSPAYHQKIEGKTKIEALALLGDPAYCVQAKSALHCAFRDGDVGVEFIDGKVDEITVKGSLGNAAFSKDSLALLGLPVKDANFSNKNVMRWENISGLLSVTLHSAGTAVSLATVKAKTK
ncbi:MAG: hypothetical protein Q8R54_03625 [Methylobacter sp.]|nr:hypothetical protein [Methylobacter sp.]